MGRKKWGLIDRMLDVWTVIIFGHDAVTDIVIERDRDIILGILT